MPWFKVDDGLHSHPKWVTASGTAKGLWVTAGSWCAAHLTDGFVPATVLVLLGGRPRDARELVELRLWDDVGNGWRFHDWESYQPSAESITAERAAARDRQRRARERAKATPRLPSTSTGNSHRDAERDAERESRANHTASHGPPIPIPSPDLTPKGGTTTHEAARESPPPRRCIAHRDWPDDAKVPRCGQCADARRAADAWAAAHPAPEPAPYDPLAGQQAASLAKAAANVAALDRTQPDPELNLAGIAKARYGTRPRPAPQEAPE